MEPYIYIETLSAFSHLLDELEVKPSLSLYLRHQDPDLEVTQSHLKIKFHPRTGRFSLYWHLSYEASREYGDEEFERLPRESLYQFHHRGYNYGKIAP